MTPAHIAIQNCREKKHRTPIPAFPQIERKTLDWWKRVGIVGEWKQYYPTLDHSGGSLSNSTSSSASEGKPIPPPSLYPKNPFAKPDTWEKKEKAWKSLIVILLCVTMCHAPIQT